MYAPLGELIVRPTLADLTMKILLEVNSRYCSKDRPPENAPVQIICAGNALLLRYEGSGRSAGVILSKPLARLTVETAVTLTASLGPPGARVLSVSGDFLDIRRRSARITVYGLFAEKDVVTRILDDAGLFLQRPKGSEIDRRARYFNPMVLVRPGMQVSSAASPSVFAGRGDTGTPDNETLGEVERGQVLAIFDDAAGPDISAALGLEQSLRIVSTLME